MKRDKKMMKKNIVNKMIAGSMIAILSVGMMTGCGDSRTVTEQVNELLSEQMNSQSPSWEQVEDDLEENVKDVASEEAALSEQDNLSENVSDMTRSETRVAQSGEEQVAEIELDWGDVEVDDTIRASGASLETPIEDGMEDADREEDKLQLVFLGDSIFDMARDGTGIPYLTSKALNARCYNLAIGGTCAALHKDDVTSYDDWDSSSVLGVAKAIAGDVSPDCINGYHAREVFDRCDFSKTDYFIIECGTNDFLSQYPISRDQGGTYDWYTYYGAVESMINDLQGAYPGAEIIFCTPHYEQIHFKEKGVAGDVNTLDLGKGPLIDYIAAGHNAASVAGAHAINCYNELNINGYTADDYLLDGIHLNEAGRQLYADMLVEHITRYEMEKGN